MNEIAYEASQPEDSLIPERVQELNSAIWRDTYTRQHDYLKAEQDARSLRERAIEQGINNPEVIAGLLITEGFAQYRQDVNAGVIDNRSWVTARQGLDLLINPETDHGIRSGLFGVAGLCQKYIVKEQDQPAELLLRSSLEEAQRSEDPSRVGEATNEFGILYFSLARDEEDTERKENYYEEAIPVFEEAARIHEEAGTREPIAGHPYNNLIECYFSVGSYDDAVVAADKALEKYNDERSPHSFSARFRKSLALRGRGRQNLNRSDFEEAISIYNIHINLRTEDKERVVPDELEERRLQRQSSMDRFITNEQRNIEETRQEMQAIFGQQS